MTNVIFVNIICMAITCQVSWPREVTEMNEEEMGGGERKDRKMTQSVSPVQMTGPPENRPLVFFHSLRHNRPSSERAERKAERNPRGEKIASECWISSFMPCAGWSASLSATERH